MDLKQLINELNNCYFIFEVIGLSRTWFHTASEFEYKQGKDLLINKAIELNKIYSFENLSKVLILRDK